MSDTANNTVGQEHGVPGAYEFYWQCRAPKCRAVHWYGAECCQRCGKPLFRYNNPNFRKRKKRVE